MHPKNIYVKKGVIINRSKRMRRNKVKSKKMAQKKDFLVRNPYFNNVE